MRIMSIDPGALNVGWAVFDGEALIGYGHIDNKKVDYTARFSVIQNRLEDIATKYHPDEVAVERAVRWRNKEIPELKVACLAIKKWAKVRKLKYTEHHTATWKASVTGNSSADKEATARIVYLRFPALPQGLPDHVTDAIAIGCYHVGVRRYEDMAK